MDLYVEFLENQWESRGFLEEFYMSFYKDAMGISVRILWGFNEIISIWMSARIQWYYKGILWGLHRNSKGFQMDVQGVCNVPRRIPKRILKGIP